MKKLKLLLSLLCVILFINSFSNIVLAAFEPPTLNSEGVVLMDASSGQVVFSKNPDAKYFPASTTKILTALIVIETSKLDERVTVGKKPPFAEGTSIGLREGEIYTIKELLSGLLLESGNDCAETLAEHISGSTEEFAKLMNTRAKELGCSNSNFKNPSGLPDEEHYTTPKDLALIMRACTKNPTFVEISRTPSLDLQPSPIDGYIRKTNNRNLILFPSSKYYYKYSVASKKGYTVAAKFTNAISATKNGKTYVGTFLKGDGINEVYKDIANIFDYVFDNFKDKKIISEGDEVGSFTVSNGLEIPLLASEDVYYTVPIDDNTNINSEVKFDIPTGFDDIDLKRGDKITTCSVIIKDDIIESIDLVSGVNKISDTSVDSKTNYISNHKYILGLSAAIIFLLFFRIISVKRRKFRKYNKKSYISKNQEYILKNKKPYTRR